MCVCWILDFGGNTISETKHRNVTMQAQHCTCTWFYLVSLSGSSYVIWHTFPWVFLCTHSNLRRPFVCCGWWCLAPGLQYTGDQRPVLCRSMFPGAGCPDLDQLPSRRWKHFLPHDWECCIPMIFWRDCQDLPKKMQLHIRGGVRGVSRAAHWVVKALVCETHHIKRIQCNTYYFRAIVVWEALF